MEPIHRSQLLLQMLDKEPGDLFLNYALGLEYVSESVMDKAEGAFKQVLSLDESYIPAYYQLGKLMEQQNSSAALVYFKKGLKVAQEKKDHKAINEFGEAIFMLED